MANTLITPTWVVKKVGALAINSLKFANNVTRKYSADFKAGGAKVGATFNLRLPQRFQTTKGQAFQQQNITDLVVPVTITDQANVGISWSTFSSTLEIEEVQNRYIRPGAVQLANTIDFDGLSRMTNTVFHAVGTPGTTPTTSQTYLDAVTKLRNVGVPDESLVAILSPNMSATLVANMQALFNPGSQRSEDWRKGQFGSRQLGVEDWYYDQNTRQRTTGSFTSATPLVNATTFTEGMTTVVTDGWASGASTLEVGDIVTLASVNEINPENYTSTGQLMQLTITVRSTDTAGAMTLTFSPALTSVGALANVDALPANNAPIIPLGSTITTGSGALTATATREGLIYHPDAFVLGFVDADADLPGADVAMVSDGQLGFSLRYARQWNASTDQKISRVDCFYGWKEYRPEWAVRVEGGAS
jgi:hypothetical protein